MSSYPFPKCDLTPTFSYKATQIFNAPIPSPAKRNQSVTAKAPTLQAQNKDQHENTLAVV